MNDAIDPVSGIYLIRHKASGKGYVGSSVNMRKRVYEHRRLLSIGRHKNAHLQSAFSKYGADAFEVVALARVPDAQDLYRVEQRYLNEMRTFDPAIGFNKASDTTAPQRGLKRSAETRAKIGAAKVGNKNRLGIGFSEESKRKISESLRGQRASPETCAKLSAARKGVPHSTEWAAKIGAAHKGKTIPQEMRDRISATLKQRHLAKTAAKETPSWA